MQPTCPICGSADLTIVREFTAEDAAQQFVMAEQDADRHAAVRDEIARLWDGDRAVSRECNRCGFGFADPFVAGNARFYQLAFGESGYSCDKWEFQRTIQALSQIDCHDWSVLEIGAGGGFFLDQLDRLGIAPERRYATEYNDITTQRMRAKGYQVEPLEIEQLDRFGQSFDAIFMFQVLEHRDRLDVVFDTVRTLLKPGGQLFIAVPNGSRVRFAESSGSLLDAPPNHVSQWRIESFRLLSDRFGFDLVAAEIEPASIKQYVREDALYSFMRRAQAHGPVSSYLFSRRRDKLTRVVLAAAIAAGALTRLPMWIRRRKEIAALGPNIWVQMERNDGWHRKRATG